MSPQSPQGDFPPNENPPFATDTPPRSPSPNTPKAKTYHPHLTGDICDRNGIALPAGTPPMEIHTDENAWAPFTGEAEFHIADLLFRKEEMSQSHTNELLDIWLLYQRQISQQAQAEASESRAPFIDHADMFSTIDEIQAGSAPWKIWYRDPDTVIANILSNPEFSQDFDTAPYIHMDKAGKRRWSDFMSGNFAWRHATQIYDEDKTGTVDGAMLIPVILGANKTTVSVTTGHVEYHPLYLTIGNITNAVRHAHANAVIPIGFLAIPKFFKKKLYHNSITAILKSLRPGMTVPVVRQCPDGHFRRVIYDLAAFIADYLEQVLLAGIVQGWCGCCTSPSSNLSDGADHEYSGEGKTLWDNFGIDEAVTVHIHEMLSADLLHQIIKGCFKDMLVDWVFDYLIIEHGEQRANEIMDDIDQQIALAPAFPGLRRFPHGRRFKQWTGNDSKALMKVVLPAIAEYVPKEMMRCLSAFLDFCHIVQHADIDETSLHAIKTTLENFHHYHEIFRTSGVHNHFSLPRMHAMIHYPALIIDFGTPNGLCSSITESHHISAVKKPWRRSNRYNALSQMLLTNQQIDKLIAFHSNLVSKQLLQPLCIPPDSFDAEKNNVSPIDSNLATAKVELAKRQDRSYPRNIQGLSAHISQPQLEGLTCQFLGEQLKLGDSDEFPCITGSINVFPSAVVMFYAPSDISGIRGMKCKWIRCTPSWYNAPRYDTVLATIDEDQAGFQGMSVARALLFFSFKHQGMVFPCVLQHWYNTYGKSCDPKTGLWMVRPAYNGQDKQNPCLAVVHLDTLVHGVHLMPVYGDCPVPTNGLKHYHSLDVFNMFYVNKYADYHSNEIIF
ncbi:hypothetical protein BT96DRAFT_958047 [Gymnopus androsaceus JB14]|uniref:CxC2-like cysteine cluster KDZ transposase-associated domain-containing protein n=1 Tax=Gymnopus androsaceus JB14 TaxID=1447944 RepID=A0A6A4HGL2_9AGAR|nr:hypothetical protein BT96DRAFT_958047 [Gymnopus androsaceus JB14]